MSTKPGFCFTCRWRDDVRPFGCDLHHRRRCSELNTDNECQDWSIRPSPPPPESPAVSAVRVAMQASAAASFAVVVAVAWRLLAWLLP